VHTHYTVLAMSPVISNGRSSKHVATTRKLQSTQGIFGIIRPFPSHQDSARVQHDCTPALLDCDSHWTHSLNNIPSAQPLAWCHQSSQTSSITKSERSEDFRSRALALPNYNLAPAYTSFFIIAGHSRAGMRPFHRDQTLPIPFVGSHGLCRPPPAVLPSDAPGT
jgi:hypothetical protein